MKTTEPDQMTKLLKARADAQRKLRPLLEGYEAACQALEQEIARAEGRTAKRAIASANVEFSLDGVRA